MEGSEYVGKEGKMEFIEQVGIENDSLRELSASSTRRRQVVTTMNNDNVLDPMLVNGTDAEGTGVAIQLFRKPSNCHTVTSID